MVKRLIRFTTLLALVLLGGCAALRQAPDIGDPEDLVRKKMGTPTSIYGAGNDRIFEYATGPMGQHTWMARIGADGRLASYGQVLTGEKFASIPVDRATKEDVLRTIGRPAERSFVALKDYEVWSYRYKEAGVWNSMMHVHFDRQGIVRQMLNGPDPMYEPRDRMGW
jgi:hypothetical protein